MVHFNNSDKADHGSTDVDNKEIYINTKYNEEVQRETLHHEILHAALLDFPNMGKEMDSDKQEEDIIRYISPILVTIYRENKWLRDFIYGA